jgi:hypothetical protein
MKNSYIEKKYFIERKFEIYGDILKIEENDILEAKRIGEVDLKVIKPAPDTGSYRKFRFWSISFVFVLIFITFSLFCNELVRITENFLSLYAFVLYLILYVGILFSTRKKIIYNSFINRNEIGIFDIYKIGKHKDEYDDFIELLKKTINRFNNHS